jgi:hypothetical protein
MQRRNQADPATLGEHAERQCLTFTIASSAVAPILALERCYSFAAGLPPK